MFRAARSRFLLAVAALLWPATAPADTPIAVRLQVSGACPSVKQLRTRLAPVVKIERRHGSGWTLKVDSRGSGPVLLRLLAPDGRPSLERMVPSRDCAAVAEALAIILDAHFLRLRAVDHKKRDRAAATQPVKQPPPPAEASPATIPASQPAPPQPAGGRMVISAALSAGARVTWEPSEVSAFFRLQLLGRWSALPLVVGLGAGLATPMEVGDAAERVRLQQGTSRLELGLYLPWRRWWMVPAAGVGLVWTLATSLDLEGQPSETAVGPLVSAALAAGYRITGRVSLWAGVTAEFYPTVYRFNVHPAGEAARSPWGGVRFCLGVRNAIF